MKKTLSLIIGSTILAGFAAMSVNASRDAYHSYMYKRGYYNKQYDVKNPDNLSVRVVTKRVYANRQGSTYVKNEGHTASGPEFKNYRGSKANSELWSARDNQRQAKGVSKTFSDRKGPWHNEGETRSNTSFTNVPKAVPGETVSTERFVVEIPTHWSQTLTEKGLSAGSLGIDLSLEYNAYDCGVIGFFTCGVTLSKNDNQLTDIYTTSRVERLISNTFKFLDSNDVTPTYTESFTGYENGKDVFITRYHVLDGKGGIYTLKAQSGMKYAPMVVSQSAKIFNSFHIK